MEKLRIKDFQLYNGFLKEVELGNVSVSEKGDLRLFKYSQKCVLENCWTDASLKARGIIFDKNGVLISRGFSKFFNLLERPETQYDSLPWTDSYTVYEKLDGSLIHIWFHDGKWNTSTNGSFDSDQAVAARKLLEQYDLSSVPKNCTILAELIGPSNRIVISYPKDTLILLSVMRNDWTELTLLESQQLARSIKMEHVGFVDLSSDEILNYQFPENFEGFVIRFKNDFRVKVKSPLYVQIHKLLNYLSPKGIINLIREKDYQATLEKLPPIIQQDFDDIRAQVQTLYDQTLNRAKTLYERVPKAVSRKDQALFIIANASTEDRGLVFGLLDNRDVTDAVWKKVMEKISE